MVKKIRETKCRVTEEWEPWLVFMGDKSLYLGDCVCVCVSLSPIVSCSGLLSTERVSRFFFILVVKKKERPR